MSKPIKLALILDDDEIAQRFYTRVLVKCGLVENIKCFTYADDALAFLKQNQTVEVDVIFLDINMPRMNGFEFLSESVEQLGQEFAKVIVAMLTTSLLPADRERAESFEIVKDFINKPLTVEHVEQIVKLLHDR